MRYYLTQRPPMPGAIPRGAIAVAEYDGREFVREINRAAYGWAEYDHPLTKREIEDYELVEASV